MQQKFSEKSVKLRVLEANAGAKRERKERELRGSGEDVEEARVTLFGIVFESRSHPVVSHEREKTLIISSSDRVAERNRRQDLAVMS